MLWQGRLANLQNGSIEDVPLIRDNLDLEFVVSQRCKKLEEVEDGVSAVQRILDFK